MYAKILTESINERVDLCLADWLAGRQGGQDISCGICGGDICTQASKDWRDTHAGVDFKPISKPDKCAA